MLKLVTLLLSFSTVTAWSATKASSPRACTEENLPSVRGTEVPLGILGLPKSMFVARSAEFTVATLKEKRPVRIQARQSFTKIKAEVVCADAGFPEAQFAMYAPTLINFSSESKIPHSVWQFQLMANSKQLGIWNTRSHLQSIHQDLSTVEGQAGTEIQVFQTEHDRYVLLLQRQSGDTKEVLTIQYDVVQ